MDALLFCHRGHVVVGSLSQWTHCFSVIVDTFKFSTSTSKNYHQLYVSVLDRTFFYFHVRAAADVHVALTNIHGVVDTHTYELILGAENNQKTYLKVSECRHQEAHRKTFNVRSNVINSP